MTIYLDALWAINAVMDGVILLGAARLAGVRMHPLRLAGACALGGGYAILCVLVPVFGHIAVRLPVGALLCQIAASCAGNRVRFTLLFYVLSAAFAGLAHVLGVLRGVPLYAGGAWIFALPMPVLALTAALGYMVSGILLRGDAYHGVMRRQVAHYRIVMLGKQSEFALLHDTGCVVHEPLSGRPAIVLKRQAVERVSSVLAQAAAMPSTHALAALPHDIMVQCGLLPYHAVGVQSGMLLYVRPTLVERADGVRVDCVVAIAPEGLCPPGCDGIIGA